MNVACQVHWQRHKGNMSVSRAAQDFIPAAIVLGDPASMWCAHSFATKYRRISSADIYGSCALSVA
jgi:hypothetical protein